MRLSAKTAKLLGISRRAAKEAIARGLVETDGKICRKDVPLTGEETVKYLASVSQPIINKNDFLIKETEGALFLYKPPFMHSERLRPSDDLALSDVFKEFPGFRPLSRLDYEADGVTAAIKEGMEITFLQKRYLAIVTGKFPRELRADWQIDAIKRKKVKVTDLPGGNGAIMKRLKYKNGLSLIEITLEKAARHQVRAFCAYAGHPILGDRLYGGPDFPRLSLHCENYCINEYSANSGKWALKFCNLVDLDAGL